MIRATLLAVALLMAATSSDAMVVRMSMDDLVQESADIVQGQVVSRESHMLDGSNRIVTDTQILISESWAGKQSAGKTITVRTLGGVVGEVGEMVEHQPVFGATEEVVLFVQPDGQGNVRCVYDSQGKFAVGGNYIVGFDLTPRSLASFRQKIDELVIRQEGPR